jgi:hypothetical protein
MAELKTQATRASAARFINAINDDQLRVDCRVLLKIMKEVSKKSPTMWGTSIIGFGSYHYRYASGREGDWFRIGFSPRKGKISIYLMGGLKTMTGSLKRLGKHKQGGGCLYIKRLDDIDQGVLKNMLKTTYRRLEKFN